MKVARQWQIVLRKQHQQVAQGKKVRKAVKTTETSQEEVTQETAKQAETKAPLETPEIKTNTTEQPAENSSENDRQRVFRHVGCRIIK